jgi:hypothetical protein
MRFRTLLSLSGIFLLIQTAFSPLPARACETVDLNASPSSPFRQLPVYDQDGTGTCYAHGAATLANYELIRSGTRSSDLVNPLFAGWVYRYEDRIIGSASLDSGHATPTLRSLRDSGHCPTSEVSRRLSRLRHECAGSLTDAQIVYILDLVYSNTPSRPIRDPEEVVFRREASFDSFQTAIERAAAPGATRGFVDGCQVRRVGADLRGLSSLPQTASHVLRDLFEGCTRRPLTSLPEPNDRTFGNNERMLAGLNASLNAGRPASIALCSEMLIQPSYQLRNLSPPANRGSIVNTPSPCGFHEVVITARKQFGSECRYLIRNSWGALWRPSSTANCACYLTDGTYQDICTDPARVREYVGCWYPSDHVGRNVTSITTFANLP